MKNLLGEKLGEKLSEHKLAWANWRNRFQIPHQVRPEVFPKVSPKVFPKVHGGFFPRFLPRCVSELDGVISDVAFGGSVGLRVELQTRVLWAVLGAWRRRGRQEA